jgi:aquaporin TIP
MTFLLVMTVYAAAVVKPGHGNTAPLAIGLSLYAAALTGARKIAHVPSPSLHCGGILQWTKACVPHMRHVAQS